MNRLRVHTPLFADHPRSWRENKYVYPVISRRSHGLSIGINLNTDRICNFDCVYCCVDRSAGPLKPQRINVNQLRDELAGMLEMVRAGAIWLESPFDKTPEPLRRLNDIAFSGDGEPTAAPEFLDCCHLAADLLAKSQLADAKIVLITNATLFHRPKVQEALRFLDHHRGEIWAKLDAGNADAYQRLMKTSIPFEQIIRNILLAGKDRPIVIQSMFLRLNDVPPTTKEISDYVNRLVELRSQGCQISLVQAYTVARPVYQTHVTPLLDAELDDITARIRAAGFTCEAYYSASK